jgi:hypothetical protein
MMRLRTYAVAIVALAAGARAATITIAGPQYEAVLHSGDFLQGRVAARTGPEHPVTTTVLAPAGHASAADVLRPAVPQNAWTLRSYLTGRDYPLTSNDGWDHAAVGFSCISLDSVSTPLIEHVVSGGLGMGE